MSDLVVTFIADWCFTAQHTLLCPSFFWLTIGLFPVWKFYTIRMLWICCTNLWGFKFSFFLGKCLGEEMLGHRVGPHLSWWETVFPKDYHFALTPAKFLRCFPSSTCYPLSFTVQLFQWVWVVPHPSDVLYFFMCLLVIQIISFVWIWTSLLLIFSLSLLICTHNLDICSLADVCCEYFLRVL